MTGALIILAATVLVGIILYIQDRLSGAATSESPTEEPQEAATDAVEVAAEAETATAEDSSVCCGLHLICEKEMEAIERNEINYYDDEELDRFADREPQEYTEAEAEEFRDVLMTLLPEDIPGWARSLDSRHIRPPQEIRDELLLLLRDLA